MKIKPKLIASLKIWIAIYPLLTFFLYMFKDQLSEMPIYVRTFFVTITLVPIIVFIGIPFIDAVLSILTKRK